MKKALRKLFFCKSTKDESLVGLVWDYNEEEAKAQFCRQYQDEIKSYNDIAVEVNQEAINRNDLIYYLKKTYEKNN